jgi:hypothetical protein
VAVVQRLPLWHPVVLAYLLPVALVLGGFMALLTTLSAAALAQLSSLLGNLTLFSLVVMFVLVGAWRKVPVYEAFVEGAREGFDVAKGLLPYLVAMLCAVGVLRTSGPWGTRWRESAGAWKPLAWTRGLWMPCPPRWSSPFQAARRGPC